MPSRGKNDMQRSNISSGGHDALLDGMVGFLISLAGTGCVFAPTARAFLIPGMRGAFTPFFSHHLRTPGLLSEWKDPSRFAEPEGSPAVWRDCGLD
jgi:hypothetical protein